MTLLQLLGRCGIACLAAAGGTLAVALPAPADDFLERQTFKARAATIHRRVLTVDSHVDTPMRMWGGEFDIGRRHDVYRRGGRVDLPRMKEGGLDAIFFAVYMGQGQRTPAGYARAKKKAVRIFSAIHDALGKNESVARRALTPDDAYRIEAEGKCAVYIGIENGYPIGKDLSLLRDYYDRGARYITLCHSLNNDICDSSTDDKPEHHGLSAFGRRVVREMNRLGMMVDVSHASDESFFDVIRFSRAPIIASHSCAREVCQNPRNLDDTMLRALAKNRGVVQICILAAYITEPKNNPERAAAMTQLRSEYDDYESLSDDRKQEVYLKWEAINLRYPDSNATVVNVVDHIDHVVRVAGIDHVGIGTDFDGGGGLEGCQDVSQIGNITLELVKRGYSEPQIRQIWGGNLMRVFREVERVATQMSDLP